MTLSITLQEQRYKLYQLKLEDNYSESEELKFVSFNNHPNNGIEITYRIHYMSGFCLVEEIANANRFETIELKLKGNCHIVSVYNSGKFDITNYDRALDEFYVAGSIDISNSRQENWGLIMNTGQKTHRYIFIFSHEYLLRFLENEKWISKPYVSSSSNHDEQVYKGVYIDDPIKGILNEISNTSYQSVYRRAFIELKIKELIFFIHTQRRNVLSDDILPASVHQKLLKAKAFLTSNYIDCPSIAQLSRIVSLNEFYLKIHFKALFGITVHNFVIQLRMEAAEKLLKKECNVIEVSARTGYRSTSHFISVFKKHFGKTPKQAAKDFKINRT